MQHLSVKAQPSDSFVPSAAPHPLQQNTTSPPLYEIWVFMKMGLVCQNSQCCEHWQYWTPKDIIKEDEQTKKDKQTTCIFTASQVCLLYGSYVHCFSGGPFCITLKNIFKQLSIRDIITHFLLPSAEQPEWSLTWRALNDKLYNLKVCTFYIYVNKGSLIAK